MANTPGGLLSLNVFTDFYKNKSILNSYSFEVMLNFDAFTTANGYPLKYAPKIQPYHISSIDLPTNSFSRESMNIGALQYSYPILTKEQPLDVKITFEEDNVGLISSFARELEGTVIKNGLHNAPILSRLGDIVVVLKSQDGRVATKIICRDVYFLGVDGISVSYESSDAIKYNVTFGCDYISYGDLYDETSQDLKTETLKRRTRLDDIALSKASFR